MTEGPSDPSDPSDSGVPWPRGGTDLPDEDASSEVRASGTGGGSPPPRGRSSAGGGWFGWIRRLAKLWGFLGFFLFVLVLFRQTILPFIFAVLLAYILAPVIGRMSARADGSRRMPRGLAIVTVYIGLLACLTLFFFALLPRVSDDLARLGREAPSLYSKVNDEWAPAVARWLESRFPSLAARPPVHEPEAAVADVPLPPGTLFVFTPLPDGRFAGELQPNGLTFIPQAGGGYQIAPSREPPEEMRTEDKIRALASKGLVALQAELDSLLMFGRRVLTSTINAVFKFFLVLMIAAFILLDLKKIHAFARSLIPGRYGHDYEVVVAAIDRGLSGVIRGQLAICLLNGALTYIGLLIFQVKYSLVLAMVATLLSLIPIFGSVLSTIPIVLAALVSGDAGIDLMRGIFILLWILGIHFLEANLLNPKILGDAAKIHPVLVVFALLAGEHTYGLVGALLAVPVASIIQVFFVFFRSRAWRTEPA
jgi:predicted PurR-regulated permease PerM